MKTPIETPTLHPPETAAPVAGSIHVAPTRDKRIWALALGTAAVWYLDPALAEMAELVGGIACASNKSQVKEAISDMRLKAGAMRQQVGPLQASWDHFLACLRSSPKR